MHLLCFLEPLCQAEPQNNCLLIQLQAKRFGFLGLGLGGTVAHCCIAAYSKDCSLASNLQAQQQGFALGGCNVALSDTQIDSIQCLNFAQNWFNSIFNSKLFHENSIQKIIQFKIVSWKFNSKDYSIQNKSLWFNSIDYSIQNKALWFNSINYSIQ